jgi:xanthine dehydrogenase accessory factor
MSAYFIDDIIEAIQRWGQVVRVVITRTHGSTPRDVGAAMIVGEHDFSGTIGGGKLEYLALDQARQMLGDLENRVMRKTQNFVLGTELRQCCGGVAWLLLECYGPDQMVKLETLRADLTPDSLIMRSTAPDGLLYSSVQHLDTMMQWPVIAGYMRDILNDDHIHAPILVRDEESSDEWFLEPAAHKRKPLFIYGAGHVGRALVRVLEDTPFDITWVETDKMRFPSDVRKGIACVVSKDQAEYAGKVSGANAFHVVITYSHEADLNICRAILQKGKGQYLGLIASESKKAKFLNRLKKDGVTEAAFKMFRCPIGLMSFTHKDPSIVAISIAAQLIAEYEQGACDVMAALTGERE